MDIPRQSRRPNRMLRVLVYTLAVGGLLGVSAFGFSFLKPAMPSVGRQQIVVGTVKRGTLVRQVRGPGRLVSEEVALVTSETSGRVKKVYVQSGATVTPDTLLMELENPIVEKRLMDAQLSLKATQASLTEYEVRLQRDNLDLRASTSRSVASYHEAKLQAEIDDELWKNGLISERQHRLSLSRASQAQSLRDIQLERVRLSQQTIQENLSVQRQRVELAKHDVKLAQDVVDSLKVRAGTAGSLQQVGPTPGAQLEIGQQVGNGNLLAVIATSNRLKAELEIPQAQGQDIVEGQPVRIEAVSSRDVIQGEVLRIDPSVQSGTLLVEVKLTSELPRGSRPDLTIHGIIELERLDDVLYVDRPSYATANTQTELFKLEGDEAVRTVVNYGTSSVYTIEIASGLTAGDEIILSDTSQWEGIDRLLVQ